MATIELDGLTKDYGGVTALSGVDLSVEEGEIFGFLGPNGAGKSTTINILLDFVRPTAGSATVLGMDAQDESKAVRSRTGVMPEGYQVYSRLTGRQHVEFVVDSKDADDDPDAVLERVGIADAADRSAGDYSKGMKQRLTLGMALVGDPDLLILDEPSTGLDPSGVREIRSIVDEESAEGTTVFFSSHILSQVEAVCDRVGILRQGELVAVDTVEGLRSAAGTEPTLRIQVDSVSDEDLAAVRALDGVERASMTTAPSSSASPTARSSTCSKRWKSAASTWPTSRRRRPRSKSCSSPIRRTGDELAGRRPEGLPGRDPLACVLDHLGAVYPARGRLGRHLRALSGGIRRRPVAKGTDIHSGERSLDVRRADRDPHLLQVHRRRARVRQHQAAALAAHDRREVVFGKVVGRTGVLAVPVIGALVLGTVVGSALIGAVDPLATVLLLVVVLFFALTYVSAMVGFSAMTASSGKAAALTLGVFVIFELFWDVFVLAAVFAASGFEIANLTRLPDWAFVPG